MNVGETARCEGCGEAVLVRLAYQAVEGWVRPRTQGGANAIAGRKMLPRYKCDGCIRREKLGIASEQEGLL